MSIAGNQARLPLAFLPTPLHPLDRISHELGGPRIWIKRDDQTGLVTGGNKTRKLEFLVGEALALGCNVLLTTGAAQSNHCRQTAAAAVAAGMDCHLVLSGAPNGRDEGNLMLDRLLGAVVHWSAREMRLAELARLSDELRTSGHKPYAITYGGSDPVGATGYAVALEELREQVRDAGLSLDAIVFASSSGGTQAGLVAGSRLLNWDVELVGISVDEQAEKLQSVVADLATRTLVRLGEKSTVHPDEVLVEAGYLGGGYGVVGELERQAILRLARAEAILLDPVYTGRAFGGLMDLITRKRFGPGQNVLFWHTGGTPALFAYGPQLGL
jgi:D-cysteine desulfhydrase